MHRSTTTLSLINGLLAMLAIGDASFGQVDLHLLIQPWEDSAQVFESRDDLVFVMEGTDGESGEDISIFDWDSAGRAKFDRDDEPSWSLGYRFRAIEIDRSIEGFPSGLTDLALAAALPLNQPDEGGWSVGLVAGAGTANDNHYRNTDAIYGIGTLDFSTALASDRTLRLGVDYRGNRALWPDVPLPYAMLEGRYGDNLTYRFGLPFTGLSFAIGEPFEFDLEFVFPWDLRAEARYRINEDFSLFADYRRTIDGFHREDSETRRIFYQYGRVEGGVRWLGGSLFDISVSVGYAFDQDFSRGFDIRDLDTVASPSDEMLISLTLRGTF